MFVTRSCHVNARTVSQLPPRIIRLSTYFPPFRSGWNSWRLYKRAAITRKFADSSHCSNLSISYKRDDSVGQRADEVLQRVRLAIENGYVSSLIARQMADTLFVSTRFDLIFLTSGDRSSIASPSEIQRNGPRVSGYRTMYLCYLSTVAKKHSKYTSR